MKCLLGIDYGTGGGKSVVINEEGDVLGYSYREYPILTPAIGHSTHNPADYWRVAQETIREATTKAGITGADIIGVAVSSALPSAVFVDSAGEPLVDAYNLLDRRANKEVDYLRNLLGSEELLEFTKNPIEDHPLLCNLLWEKTHHPDIYSRIYKALTIDGYITMKLTGKFVMHRSAATFYGVAYDIVKGKFSDEIMEKIGISPDVLPEIHSCEEVVGGITKEAALATGLAPGTKVAAGQVDCNAGWSGAGAINVGDVQMNLGTCGNFGVVHNGEYFNNTMHNFPYTTDSRNTYITVATTLTGGQVLRYIRDLMYMHESSECEKSGENIYSIMSEQAAAVPLGAEGLIFLPFLMGERAPIWDVAARGCLFGLSLHHTRAHVVRAGMEAVAYALYDSFRIFKEQGITFNLPLALNEGGAVSKVWRKIITDVFNTPTVVVKSRVGAPYGDAVLAGVAAGVFKDFSIAKEKTELVDRLEPDQGNHERYMKYFGIYKDIYNHVKDDYRHLAELVRTLG